MNFSTKNIVQFLIAISVICTASASTFSDTSDEIRINGPAEVEFAVHAMHIRGQSSVSAFLDAGRIEVEVDHSNYERQLDGIAVEPSIYTSYPGNSSKSFELSSSDRPFHLFVFPLPDSPWPTATVASSEFEAKPHQSAKFEQTAFHFQERQLPTQDVDATSQLNVEYQQITVSGNFMIVVWEIDASFVENGKVVSTGYFEENQTYLPNGEVFIQDEKYRTAYFTIDSGSLSIEVQESESVFFSDSFSASSSTPPTLDGGREFEGINGTQEYVLHGSQIEDGIQFELVTDSIEEPVESEPQVTVPKSVIPQWAIVLAVSLPLPLLIVLIGGALLASTRSIEDRARRGQSVVAAPWVRFLPRIIRERHLRAQCISRFKIQDEQGLKEIGEDLLGASKETKAFHEFLMAKLCISFGRFQDAKDHVLACLDQDSRFQTELALDSSLHDLMETDS